MRCGPAAPVRSSFYRVENNNVRLQMRRIHAARSPTNSLINDLGAFVGCIAGEAKTIMLKMTIIRATASILRAENVDLREELRGVQAYRKDSRVLLYNLRSFIRSVAEAARVSMLKITLSRKSIGVGRRLPSDVIGMIVEFAGAPFVCSRPATGVMIHNNITCVRALRSSL
jgi:hypothetical protein